MAESLIATCRVGPAAAARNGGRTASLSTPQGCAPSYITTIPLPVPFEAQGWGGDEARQTLALQLDEEQAAYVSALDECVRDRISKTLGLDPRDYVPLCRANEKYETKLLKCKIWREGRHKTNFWQGTTLLPDRPEVLQNTRCAVRVQFPSVWIQNRQWGLVTQATDVEVHEEQVVATNPFGARAA